MLTHKNLHKMADILQTVYSNLFPLKINCCIVMELSQKFILMGIIVSNSALFQCLVSAKYFTIQCSLDLSVITRGQFWPSGIVVACVCVCACVCPSIISLSVQ